MTFPDTIPAWMTETPSMPDCPAWCTLHVGHHNRMATPRGWNRSHVAWSAAMTYRDGPGSTGVITAEVSQYEVNECGDDYVLEPVRLWLRGVPESSDGSLAVDDAAVFADLIGRSANVMSRISGGRA